MNFRHLNTTRLGFGLPNRKPKRTFGFCVRPPKRKLRVRTVGLRLTPCTIMFSYYNHIRVVAMRSGQEVPLLIPILNVQFDTDGQPESVILGSPRTVSEVWMEDCCLYEVDEVVDLTPEEDIKSVQYAINFLTPVAKPEEPEEEPEPEEESNE